MLREKQSHNHTLSTLKELIFNKICGYELDWNGSELYLMVSIISRVVPTVALPSYTQLKFTTQKIEWMLTFSSREYSWIYSLVILLLFNIFATICYLLTDLQTGEWLNGRNMEVEVFCCKITLSSADSMSVRISNLWTMIWTQ